MAAANRPPPVMTDGGSLAMQLSCQSGVGNGEWQFMPYSIAFLGANKAPNGFYSDTVQVTLTYN